MKGLKFSSLFVAAILVVIGSIIMLYQYQFNSAIPSSVQDASFDGIRLTAEQNANKLRDKQLAAVAPENISEDADKKDFEAKQLKDDQRHSTSRVLSGNALVLHNQTTGSHRAKLLTQRYGLPFFSKLRGLSSESEEASSILMTKYSEYFHSQLSTEKLLQLSIDVGFRGPVRAKIRSLRSELLHLEREVKGVNSTAVLANEPNPATLLTLQKLTEQHLIESSAEDLSEGQLKRQRAARQLDAIGSKFCFDLSQFIVKKFLNV